MCPLLSLFLPHRIIRCGLFCLFFGLITTLKSAALFAKPGPDAMSDTISGCSHMITLESANSQLIPLPIAEADLITLALSIDSGEFDVDIVDQDGQHIRQVLSQNAGRKRLPIVGANGNQLRLFAHQKGQIEITCLNHIPHSEQLAIQTPKISIHAPQSPRLQQLLSDYQNVETIDKFWSEIVQHGTPLVEKMDDQTYLITFLARGKYQNIKLFGGPSHKHPGLTQLIIDKQPTDIWYLSLPVPEAAEFSYQLAPDVPNFEGSARARRIAILSTAQTDPLNKYPWPATAKDAYNQYSTLRLSPRKTLSYLEESPAQKGQIDHILFDSQTLGNKRDIWIYHPAITSPPSTQNIPLLFLFDAENFMRKGNVTRLLDNLIATNEIPPLHAVFISPIDTDKRSAELPDNVKFADFIAQELRPFILTKLGLSDVAAQQTILAGASFGGLGATTIAFRYPHIFGNVLSMSGSYWWHRAGPDQSKTSILDIIAAHPKQDIRFFITAGLFETSWDGRSDGILPLNRQLRDILQSKTYDITYQEYVSGHDIFVWRHILADGLRALLSPMP